MSKAEITIIGIDPGMDGAMAVLTPNHNLRVFRFQNKSEQEIAHALIAESLSPCQVFLEKVGAMPGQGVSSMFKFGKNYGLLRGVLIGASMSFEDVIPQKWQRGVGLGKKFPTKNHRKRATKELAQQWFGRENYPGHRRRGNDCGTRLPVLV